MIDQLDSLESAVEQRANRPEPTYDCCVKCDKLIPSWYQLKHPGTDVCDSCAVITIESDAEDQQ